MKEIEQLHIQSGASFFWHGFPDFSQERLLAVAKYALNLTSAFACCASWHLTYNPNTSSGIWQSSCRGAYRLSSVYMRALEHRAEKYDAGMQTLTLGRLTMIKEYVTENLVQSGDRILDIGVGTGTFSIMAAKKGATVTGIDNSEKMLSVARSNLEREGLADSVILIHLPIVELDRQFPDHSFNKITAMLVFSELYLQEQEYCLDQVARLLEEEGEFILVDEVRPRSLLKRLAFYIVRIPLAIAAYFRTQLTTHPLSDITDLLKENGFVVVEERYYLFNTLRLLCLRKPKASGDA
jgi:cyclopropane fatty-acyl-phospholipid synthase-like methyltransferase